MVSVCMATHNGEKFLRAQIDSILCQLEEGDELIISDDGSSDNTIDIISSYNDRRIHLLKFVQNSDIRKKKHSQNFYYATRNFENALKNAHGDFVFLADQDDIWLPNRVNKMMNKLKQYDCVMCNLNLIDQTDKIIKTKYFSENPVPGNIFLYVLKTRILGCCLAFRKELLNYSLPFPRNLLSHDYWLGCVSITSFNFFFLDEPLHLYRRTDSNVSTTSSKSRNSLLYKLQYRLEFYLQFRKFIKNKRNGK